MILQDSQDHVASHMTPLDVYYHDFSLFVYSVIPIDLGGCQCSIVYGLCTSAQSLGNILNPVIIGLLVRNHVSDQTVRRKQGEVTGKIDLILYRPLQNGADILLF